MNAQNPITIDDKVYDKLSFNLALTYFYKKDGSTDSNIAIRVIPTVVEESGVTNADSYSKGIYKGKIQELDINENECVQSLINSITNLLKSKGF